MQQIHRRSGPSKPAPSSLQIFAAGLGGAMLCFAPAPASATPPTDQGSSAMERMMEEARRRQAEMMRQAQEMTAGRSPGASQSSEAAVQIDSANPPQLVLGSLLQDGLQFRSDGRFSLPRFKLSGLPARDVDANAVRYDVPGQERLHVRLTGPDGRVLSDHRYTAVQDRQYGGWNADLSIASPRSINPDFIRHRAILAPGEHSLAFMLDDQVLDTFDFSVGQTRYPEGQVLQLDGPWRTLMAVSTNNALNQIQKAPGNERAGVVQSFIFNQNTRQSGNERQGQRYTLRVLRDGEPFAIYAEILSNESRQWEDTVIPWGRDPEGLSVSPGERSQRTWGYNIQTKRSPNTRVDLDSFGDGTYTVELEQWDTGEVRRYSFSRRGGAFIGGPRATLEPGGHTIWLTPG